MKSARVLTLLGLAGLAACDATLPTTPDAPLASKSLQLTTLAPTSVYAMGLTNPRGLRFGPDGGLYVAEAGTGGTTSTARNCHQVIPPVGPYFGGNTAQISRISPHGVKTVVVSGLPSSINAMGLSSGISDIEFIAHKLYALVDGAGCSHGHLDEPNGIIRIDGPNSWTQIANLSDWYKKNPTAKPEPDDFEPDGTPYSMIKSDGDLYVVEPNHGSFERVQLNGVISRISDISATYGHIVPTTVSQHGGHFFIGNLGTFPVMPGSEQITEVRAGGALFTWATGFTAVLGTAWDAAGNLYVLESTTAPGGPAPFTGDVVRLAPSGDRTIIANGLFLPTSMTMGPDGNLYVSNVGFGPPGPGQGSIVKIQLK